MAKRAAAAALKMDGEKKFLDLFGKLTACRSAWQVWEDLMTVMACSISNAVDRTGEKWKEREETYEKAIARLGGMDTPAEIFALVARELEKNPEQDFLGKLYMALNLGSHWHGQFFTPYHISHMMAEMTMGDGIKDEIERKGFVSVNDPCVGAGTMLISAANVMKERGVNYQTDVLFIGQDIDRVVAMMAYIQMSLLGCPGYVIVGNSLADPPAFHLLFPQSSEGQEIWITPMFLLPAWEARRLEILYSQRPLTAQDTSPVYIRPHTNDRNMIPQAGMTGTQHKKTEGEGEPPALPDRRKEEMEERQLQAPEAPGIQAGEQGQDLQAGTIVDLTAGRTLESPYAAAYTDAAGADSDYGKGILWGLSQGDTEISGTAPDLAGNAKAQEPEAGQKGSQALSIKEGPEISQKDCKAESGENTQAAKDAAAAKKQAPPDAPEEEVYETSWGSAGEDEYETAWGDTSEQAVLSPQMTEEELKAAACAKLSGELEKAEEKGFAVPIIGYLSKRCREDRGLAEDVLQDHKTWEKCLRYLHDQAKSRSKGNCAYVDDNTVYEWSEDYYHKDDKAEEEKKAREEAERKKQAQARVEKAKKTRARKAPAKKKPKAAAQTQAALGQDGSRQEESLPKTGSPGAGTGPQEAEDKAAAPKDQNGVDGQMDIFSMLAG